MAATGQDLMAADTCGGRGSGRAAARPMRYDYETYESEQNRGCGRERPSGR